MTHGKIQKQLIFDPIFMEAIKNTCANEPPEGSTTNDFRVVEQPECGALMYAPEKEAQALEVLFAVVGRIWLDAKSRRMH